MYLLCSLFLIIIKVIKTKIKQINPSYRQFLFFLIKLSIVIGTFYFIYQKTVHNKAISITEFMFQLEQKFNYKTLILLFGFTILNWFFEILKWKNLVSSIKKITFSQALKQSLGSHTASLFTPNRIGEYGAKAIYFHKKNRKKVWLLNLISNISQMTVTILFGIIGILFLVLNFEIDLPVFRFRRLIYYAVFFTLASFSGRFFISKKIRGFYWNKIINFLRNLPKIIIVKTFLFSTIRYVIFSHQFYFLLLFFDVEVDYYSVTMLIFAMYFIASIIPSLPMFDWLIKGSVAVFIFSLVEVNELVTVSITLLMWLFNFAFPAIIGSYFVLNFRPIKNN